jgi:hypothetical protein
MLTGYARVSKADGSQTGDYISHVAPVVGRRPSREKRSILAA